MFYGIVPPPPPVMFEDPRAALDKDSSTRHRSVETSAVTTHLATHANVTSEKAPHSIPTTGANVGDSVLAAPYKALGTNNIWPAFSSKFCELCMVTSTGNLR